MGNLIENVKNLAIRAGLPEEQVRKMTITEIFAAATAATSMLISVLLVTYLRVDTLDMKQGPEPATPEAGYARPYAGSNPNYLGVKWSDGTVSFYSLVDQEGKLQSADGSRLEMLNAAALASGTIPDARMPDKIALPAQTEPAGEAGKATLYADPAGNLASKNGVTSNGNIVAENRANTFRSGDTKNNVIYVEPNKTIVFKTTEAGKQFCISQTMNGVQADGSINHVLLFNYNGSTAGSGGFIQRENAAEPYIGFRLEANWLTGSPGAYHHNMEFNINTVDAAGTTSRRPFSGVVDRDTGVTSLYTASDYWQMYDPDLTTPTVIEQWNKSVGWSQWRLQTNTTKKITTTPAAAEGADRALTIPALGQDDTLVTAAYAPVCQGRLTLTGGTPITIVDVAASTNVYFTPYKGDGLSVPAASGTAWVLYHFTELACNNFSGLTANKNYDVFVWWNAAGNSLNLSVGPGWSTDTARGTGAGTTELTTLNGILVNKYSMLTNAVLGARAGRYIGTVRSISTTQTCDMAAKRFCANHYNRVQRALALLEATEHWHQTSLSTWEYANNTATNRVEFIVPGDAGEDGVDISLMAVCLGSGNVGRVGIGLDSATTPTNLMTSSYLTNGSWTQLHGRLNAAPGIGFHYASWLQWCNQAADAWYGALTDVQSGLTGKVKN